MNEKKDLAKGKDRRKAPRVTGAVVDYSLGERAPKETAFIKDISMGGLCIYVYQKIPVDTVLKLNIYLFGSKNPITVKAKVVWQSGSDYSGYYNLGMEYIEVEKQDRETLSEFITASLVDGMKNQEKEEEDHPKKT